LISLEMVCTESEVGCAMIEKQFDDMKLEVTCLNRFFEHENMANPQAKPRIFSTAESTFASLHVSVTINGPDGHHVEQHHLDREPGSNLARTHVPVKGMSQTQTQTQSQFLGVDPSLEYQRLRGSQFESHPLRGSQFESIRASQGHLPKINFPTFLSDDPQLWHSRCENYFKMYGVESSLWIKVAPMHLEGETTRWFQSVER
jgi:hypothetical protein